MKNVRLCMRLAVDVRRVCPHVSGQRRVWLMTIGRRVQFAAAGQMSAVRDIT